MRKKVYKKNVTDQKNEEIIETKQIKFTDYILSIDGNIPQTVDLSPLNNLVKECYSYNNNEYLISTSLTDSYFWMSIQYGSYTPIGNEVFDKASEKPITNPIVKGQALLNKELFVYLDIKTKHIFINNSQKKTFIDDFLTKKLNTSVRLMLVFQNAEDFISKISKLHKVSFVTENDLLNNTIINQDINHILNACSSFSLTMNFASSFHLQDNVSDALKKLTRDKTLMKKFLISADISGEECILNTDVISKNFTIVTEIDNAGMSDAKKVLTELQKCIT